MSAHHRQLDATREGERGMKAWLITSEHADWVQIVMAPTASQAKTKSHCYRDAEIAFRDIRAKRVPSLDGKDEDAITDGDYLFHARCWVPCRGCEHEIRPGDVALGQAQGDRDGRMWCIDCWEQPTEAAE